MIPLSPFLFFMKKIPLSKGQSALVDDDVVDHLNQWKWQVSHYGYAVRNDSSLPRNSRIVYMHRSIMNAEREQEVDHVNHNRLDNRKVNLRLCSHAENQRNLKRQSNNTSGYKGVSLQYPGLWHAYINWKGRRQSLGYYRDREAAAIAYNVAAQVLHGSFACLNPV